MIKKIMDAGKVMGATVIIKETITVTNIFEKIGSLFGLQGRLIGIALDKITENIRIMID